MASYYEEQQKCFKKIDETIDEYIIVKGIELSIEKLAYELSKHYLVGYNTIVKRIKLAGECTPLVKIENGKLMKDDNDIN